MVHPDRRPRGYVLVRPNAGETHRMTDEIRIRIGPNGEMHADSEGELVISKPVPYSQAYTNGARDTIEICVEIAKAAADTGRHVRDVLEALVELQAELPPEESHDADDKYTVVPTTEWLELKNKEHASKAWPGWNPDE